MPNLPLRRTRLLFATLLSLAVILVYLPGTFSNFLFDDFWNLQVLDQINRRADAPSFIHAIFSNQSGPMGRPVSMLTFALQASSWPAHPEHFKQVNLLLHLVTAWLLYVFVHRLAIVFRTPPMSRNHLASITACLWAFHPLLATTVLYPVQRMTILAALFGVLALIQWLRFRETAISRQGKILWHHLLLATAAFLLAIFSKENAVTIFLVVGVVEIVDSREISVHYRKVRLRVIALVAISALGSLPFFLEHLHTYQFRNFTLSERLLTEGRALVDYLIKAIHPNQGGLSVYHDDFPVSSSLLDPPDTLASIALITILLVTALAIRHRFPAISFGVLWFFANHAIESSVFPLELYVEHRNYLPLFGICVAISSLCLPLAKKRRRIPGMVGACFITIEAVMLTSHSLVWSQPLAHAAIVLERQPASTRALLQLAGELERSDQPELGYLLVRENIESTAVPGEASLAILLMKCKLAPNGGKDTAMAIQYMRKTPLTAGVINAVKVLTEIHITGECRSLTSRQLTSIVLALQEEARETHNRTKEAELLHLEAQIHVHEKNWANALDALDRIVEIVPHRETLLDRIVIASRLNDCARLSRNRAELEDQFPGTAVPDTIVEMQQLKCKRQTKVK